MSKVIKASDCKCCQCGKQAVCFWPIVDPDIRSYPYCRECKEEQVLQLAIAMSEQPDFIKEKK
ncbi:hypothetical protein KAR91_49420 [Candidatus Pacearchaeota archaeon]|nr:hypothetical protein [Candidatus Pacearchaeota archaeon]